MDMILFQRFYFKKPVILEDVEKGNGVTALPDKIIIRGDKETFEHDLAEMLAMAKLGEQDPLLVTFFFQKGLSEEEEGYASAFFSLCRPLQNAWVYKTMRRYAPDVYQKEVAELLRMKEAVFGDYIDVSDPTTREQVLGIWTVLYENPKNQIELVLQNETYKQEWDNYVSALKEFVRCEPDVKYYLMLPVRVNAPYDVRLGTDNNFRHFCVTRKE